MPTTFIKQVPTMPDTSYSAYVDMYRQKYPNDISSPTRAFIGSIFGGYENWANSQLAQYQNAYNQWQQEYSNWYNSPENQASLYGAADINRNLIAGSLGSGSSMSPISAQVPKVTDVGRNAFASFGTLIQLAAGILSLRSQSVDIAKKHADLDLFQRTLPDKLYLAQYSGLNSFVKYQTGLQNAYKNDWLYNTQLLPQSMDFGSVSSSPFANRFNLETSGINILNTLRSSQNVLSSLNASKLRYFNEHLQPLEEKLLEGKVSINEVEVDFKKLEKELGLANGALRPVFTILKMIFAK